MDRNGQGYYFFEMLIDLQVITLKKVTRKIMHLPSISHIFAV